MCGVLRVYAHERRDTRLYCIVVHTDSESAHRTPQTLPVRVSDSTVQYVELSTRRARRELLSPVRSCLQPVS